MLTLIEISEGGCAILPVGNLADLAVEICLAYDGLYRREGFFRPWVGYLAIKQGQVVGTCSFKSAPWNGRVQIAYFTFPEFEGQGVATSMARELIEISRATDPALAIIAHTLPEENASTAVLEKNGFEYQGMVNHPDDGLVWEWCYAAT